MTERYRRDRGAYDSWEQLEKGHACPLGSQEYRSELHCQRRQTRNKGRQQGLQPACHLQPEKDEWCIPIILSEIRRVHALASLVSSKQRSPLSSGLDFQPALDAFWL